MATTWSDTYETQPADSDAPSGGDDQIRGVKSAIRERIAKEHVMTTGVGAFADHGWHVEGSAKGFYSTAAPTNRPDGSTALDTDDAGRILFIAGRQEVPKVWSGAAWTGFVRDVRDTYIDGDQTTGTKEKIFLYPRGVKITGVAAHVKEVPTGAALRVNIWDSAADSIFKAGFLSIAISASTGHVTLANLSNNTLATDAYLGISVSQIGSANPGSGLTVAIEGVLT